MHAIIYIVFACIRACQLNLDCFETFCLALRSVHLTIGRPRQPAITLAMCCILDSQIIIARHTNLDTFQALRFSARSRHRTICKPCLCIILISLPAKRLHMGCIPHGYSWCNWLTWCRIWCWCWVRRWRWVRVWCRVWIWIRIRCF